MAARTSSAASGSATVALGGVPAVALGRYCEGHHRTPRSVCAPFRMPSLRRPAQQADSLDVKRAFHPVDEVTGLANGVLGPGSERRFR